MPFDTLNARYSIFDRLKISVRTFVQQKLKVLDWRVPLNRVLQAFELLKRFRWMDQIFGMGRC